MDYLLVGINHHTASVELREKFAIRDLEKSLKDLSSFAEISEVLVLSTCNRVEIYTVIDQASHVTQVIIDYLSRLTDHQEIEKYLYIKSGKTVSEHLFKVTSGLDSMVVGENQILGQVKDAYAVAQTQSTLGFFLNKLFHEAFRVSKQVKTQTKISQGLVSVGSVGVDLAKNLFENLSQKKVGMVGAGEMAELILQCLQQENIQQIKIINRNIEKARSLLDQLSIEGDCFGWDELENTLIDIDILICSVGAEKPVIDLDLMQRVMKARQYRVIFMIDLGVPRNLQPQINELENVYLYNIDDIKKITEKNKTYRQKEAKNAQEIIEKESISFYENLQTGRPVLKALGEKFDSIRDVELSKTLKKMSHLSQEDQKAFETCTKSIVKKILHDPMLTVKSEEGGRGAYDWIKKLFKLDDI